MATEEKTGVIQRTSDGVRHYVRETMGELRKVNWPSRKEATNLTAIVLVVTLVMALYLGLLDFIFTRAISFIL